MFKKAAYAAAAAAAFVAAPASAAIVWQTTWEADQVPDGPAAGTFKIYNNPPTTGVAGWTPDTQIELQNNVAGAPAAVGGKVFAELDADFNSSMYRTLSAGVYYLDYLYSPRPGVGFNSNGIVVTLNGAELSQISGSGTTGPSTAWSTVTTQQFTVGAGGATLRFTANGTSDSLGGYIDNITLYSAVPEPGTWALLILGFGVLGHSMRRRSSKVRIAKASLNFA
ncbi:MAG: PEPxxWA-CTERM sorting domain-containing protein [Altererythrobacter sp.]|nr:PEPxxWA-CTERM sorting domain-containing protein [Altererythrobacter sp.]